MNTHPTALELLDAVARFIEQTAAPRLTDRDAFLARVAVNALATVRRELQLGPAAQADEAERLRDLFDQPDESRDDLNDLLCESLRDGLLDQRNPEVMLHLRLTATDQVRIDQPTYSGLTAGAQSIR